MTYDQFKATLRSAVPEVSDEEVNNAWNEGDKDMNGVISIEEFMRLVQMKAKADGAEMDAEDYWHMFRGADRWIDRTEFYHGYKFADKEVSEDQITKAFEHGDFNRDNVLSKGEFMRLAEEGEESGSDHGS